MAGEILRAKELIRANVCSAVDTVFPKGVFITYILFSVAALMSTLSTPTPALPISFRFVALLIISFVTLDAERIINP